MEVNIHEAKTQLSRLLRRVAEGEEVVISRAGVPVAKLIAVLPANGARPLGAMEGQFSVPDDFDAPLPDSLLAMFYGGQLDARKPVREKSRTPARKQARK